MRSPPRGTGNWCAFCARALGSHRPLPWIDAAADIGEYLVKRAHWGVNMLKGLTLAVFMVLGAPLALADARQDCAKLPGDAAIEACDQAIRQNPSDAVSYFNRGIEYAHKGDSDPAIADCNKAIEINPKYINAYFNRGTSRFNKD